MLFCHKKSVQLSLGIFSFLSCDLKKHLNFMGQFNANCSHTGVRNCLEKLDQTSPVK